MTQILDYIILHLFQVKMENDANKSSENMGRVKNRCCVVSCSSTKNDYKLHAFVKKTDSRYPVWVKRAGLPFAHSTYRICQKHFAVEDLVGTQLRPRCSPTLHLPGISILHRNQSKKSNWGDIQCASQVEYIYNTEL